MINAYYEQNILHQKIKKMKGKDQKRFIFLCEKWIGREIVLGESLRADFRPHLKYGVVKLFVFNDCGPKFEAYFWIKERGVETERLLNLNEVAFPGGF
jgi:hypothetical protein